MTGLRREMGLWPTVATAVGIVVSSTALVSLGQGYGFGGPAFIIPMLIALVLNLFVAFSFAELSGMLPVAGGINHYTLPAMGPFMGIIAVISGYLIVSIFGGAAEAAVAGLVLHDVFVSSVSPTIWAIVILIVLILINLRGVKTFAIAQMIMTTAMIGSMIILSIIGLTGSGTGTPLETSIPFNSMGIGILSLVSAGFWLFVGMEFVCPMAEEIKNPKVYIPLAMIMALLIICVSDVLFGTMSMKYIGMEGLANSAHPHVDAANAVLGRTGQIWIGAISILATGSTLNTYVAAIPRMLYGMANEGSFPKAFGKLNKRGAPYVGIIFTGVIMIFFLATGITNIGAIVTLVFASVICWLITYIIAHLDVIIMRFKYPQIERSFKVPFGIVLPVIGILAMVYMILNIWPEYETKMLIYKYTAIFLALTAAWAAYWVKFVMKKGLFETVPLEYFEEKESLQVPDSTLETTSVSG